MSYLSPSSFYSWLSGSKNSQRDTAEQLSTVNGGLVPLDPNQRVVTTLEDDDEYAVGAAQAQLRRGRPSRGRQGHARASDPQPQGCHRPSARSSGDRGLREPTGVRGAGGLFRQALGDAKYDPIRKSNRRKSFAGK